MSCFTLFLQQGKWTVNTKWGSMLLYGSHWWCFSKCIRWLARKQFSPSPSLTLTSLPSLNRSGLPLRHRGKARALWFSSREVGSAMDITIFNKIALYILQTMTLELQSQLFNLPCLLSPSHLSLSLAINKILKRKQVWGWVKNGEGTGRKGETWRIAKLSRTMEKS